MSALSVHNLSKDFGSLSVLKDINLEVADEEFVALLGQSGSGKSTLLRLIAGFESPDCGTISLSDHILTSQSIFVKPEDRNVGVIFQDYALFPHLSVKKNIAFGVKNPKKHQNRIQELLTTFELQEQADKKPSAISGGQQQRVAIARALAVNPKLLLLDEPFSNLDQALKSKIRLEIRTIQRSFKIPMVLVTHDPDDALELADKVAVLQGGEIVQFDTPEEVYFNPINKYVASLFGPCSDFEGIFLRPEYIDFNGELYSGKVLSVISGAKHQVVTLLVNNQEVIAYADPEMVIDKGQIITFKINQKKSKKR